VRRFDKARPKGRIAVSTLNTVRKAPIFQKSDFIFHDLRKWLNLILSRSPESQSKSFDSGEPVGTFQMVELTSKTAASPDRELFTPASIRSEPFRGKSRSMSQTALREGQSESSAQATEAPCFDDVPRRRETRNRRAGITKPFPVHRHVRFV
jgi:hypothetical protein